MPTSPAAPVVPRLTRSTLPSLTGLRAVAAGVVFVYHLAVVRYAGGRTGDVVAAVTARADAGVSLFFVLSGFVLAWSHDPRTPARRFLWRRFARVWPAHAAWVVVAVTVIAAVPTLRHTGSGPLADLADTALLSAWVPAWWQAGNPVSWSLVCEAFFYALFPPLWWAFSRLHRSRAFAAVAVGLFAAVWLAPAAVRLVGIATSTDAATHHPLGRWPEFALGVLAALALRRGVWRGPTVRPAVVLLGAAYVIATLVTPDRAGSTTVLVVPEVLLVAALARADLAGRHLRLGRPVAVRLGERSFAFYLCHLLVIAVLGLAWPQGHPRLAPLPALGLAVLALALAGILAAATHRLVERPARRALLGNRSTRRRDAPQPAGVGVATDGAHCRFV